MGVSEIDLAYAAGIIDGEGTIYITPQHGYLILCVGVHMTTSEVPVWLRKTFGGGLSKHGSQNKKHKDSWRWGLTAKSAIAFLEEVYPFLKLKKPQVEVARVFQGTIKYGIHNRWNPPSEEELAVRETCRGQMRLLNLRGVQNEVS
uniref:Putative HNH homing endonuclease n=1 Tax=viral metagenome TaxID=1070528 RepID=A0A6M3L7F3_9ZZZZ